MVSTEVVSMGSGNTDKPKSASKSNVVKNSPGANRSKKRKNIQK